MKLTLIILSAVLVVGCAPRKPAIVLIHFDPNNNRVTEDGRLVKWTNWGIGFRGSNGWVKVLEAKEE